jgi:hypothetical protein
MPSILSDLFADCQRANLPGLMWALLTGSLLALTLGLRHAAEPDHLAAVSTIVAERRGRRAAVRGAVWGLGHTLSLCLVGALLLALRASLPGRIDDLFELVVALTLLWLGARSLGRAVADRGGPATAHAHGSHRHSHGGPADHLHLGGYTVARRPLVVGLLHGLAGTGALTALAMPSLGSGLWFLLLFGLGATLGMALLCGLAGAALRALFTSPRGRAFALGGAGALSLALGLFKGWPLVLRLLA